MHLVREQVFIWAVEICSIHSACHDQVVVQVGFLYWQTFVLVRKVGWLSGEGAQGWLKSTFFGDLFQGSGTW